MSNWNVFDEIKVCKEDDRTMLNKLVSHKIRG